MKRVASASEFAERGAGLRVRRGRGGDPQVVMAARLVPHASDGRVTRNSPSQVGPNFSLARHGQSGGGGPRGRGWPWHIIHSEPLPARGRSRRMTGKLDRRLTDEAVADGSFVIICGSRHNPRPPHRRRVTRG